LSTLIFSPARLKQHRTAAKLDRAHFAVLSGRSITAVESWEQGRKTPNSESLDAIADVFGIDVIDLFDEAEGGDAS
jgi:transcriptional regulator with XRE-family HTH domain